jgi:hypothetical protein
MRARSLLAVEPFCLGPHVDGSEPGAHEQNDVFDRLELIVCDAGSWVEFVPFEMKAHSGQVVKLVDQLQGVPPEIAAEQFRWKRTNDDRPACVAA